MYVLHRCVYTRARAWCVRKRNTTRPRRRAHPSNSDKQLIDRRPERADRKRIKIKSFYILPSFIVYRYDFSTTRNGYTTSPRRGFRRRLRPVVSRWSIRRFRCFHLLVPSGNSERAPKHGQNKIKKRINVSSYTRIDVFFF